VQIVRDWDLKFGFCGQDGLEPRHDIVGHCCHVWTLVDQPWIIISFDLRDRAFQLRSKGLGTSIQIMLSD